MWVAQILLPPEKMFGPQNGHFCPKICIFGHFGANIDLVGSFGAMLVLARGLLLRFIKRLPTLRDLKG